MVCKKKKKKKKGDWAYLFVHSLRPQASTLAFTLWGLSLVCKELGQLVNNCLMAYQPLQLI